MRRRNLLGGKEITYVFSASNTYFTQYSSSWSTTVNITSTADGSNIGYTASYDNNMISSVYIYPTYIYIYGKANTSFSSRGSYIHLTQNDSGKKISIYVYQYGGSLQLAYFYIVLGNNANQTGSTYMVYYDTTSAYTGSATVSSNDSWITASYSNGNINITGTTSNSTSDPKYGSVTVSVPGLSNSLSVSVVQLPPISSYSSLNGVKYAEIDGLKFHIYYIGSSSMTSAGNYYQIGKGSRTYNQTSGESAYNGTYPLPSSADTATQVLGEGWRIPTSGEWETRISVYNFAKYNGTEGVLVCNKNKTSQAFFLPKNGYYYRNNTSSNWTFNGYTTCAKHNDRNEGFNYNLNSYRSASRANFGSNAPSNYAFNFLGVHD